MQKLIISRRLTLSTFVFLTLVGTAQVGFAADAKPLGARTTNLRMVPHWTDDDHFWFRRELTDGGSERVHVDAATGVVTVDETNANRNKQREGVVSFEGGSIPNSEPSSDNTEIKFVNSAKQAIRLFWVDTNGHRVAYEKLRPGDSVRQHSYAGHVWIALGEDESFYGSIRAETPPHTATIEHTFPSPKTGLRPKARSESRTNRSHERSQILKPNWQEHIPLNATQTLWRPTVSPDGKVVAVWKRTPGDEREVYTIESSPKGEDRAKLHRRVYPLPGDRMDQFELVVLDAKTWESLPTELPIFDFGSPEIRWLGEHELLVEKVDRGHTRHRLFALDPIAKTMRTLIDEKAKTFVWTTHGPVVRPVTYLHESDEAIHSSETSGYRHLYLVDLSGEASTTPITSGNFLVRKILEIDEANRELYLLVGE